MATTLDQIERYKQNRRDQLLEAAEGIYNLGIEYARRKAEKELTERGEATRMLPAEDEDFESYRKDYHVTDDDLHFWCEKCKKPLSGHWAIPVFWEYCPWCGRKFVVTDEARKAARESRWERRCCEKPA